MSDIQAKFEAATAASKELSKRPDTDTLLKIYALYKQATVGDVEGERPGMMDFKGVAKYDAWANLEGTSTDDAMERYVKLIDSLKG